MDIPFVATLTKNKVILRMVHSRKMITIIVLLLSCSNMGCEMKREALGADNEIRVICSDVDKESIRTYLSTIFTDTLFTPEPEPYYHLKFSDPETYTKLKSQSQVVVAAINRDSKNTGFQLVKKMLSPDQFHFTETGDPVILAKNVHAKKQLFMVINAVSVEQLMSTIDSRKNLIRKQFHDQFVDRQSRYIFGDDRNKTLEDSLNQALGWTLKIPWGWEMIKIRSDSNFVWLGKEMPFQWIGIGWADGNLVNDDLSVGEYIWTWPAKNYGYIQFNDYKFELDKMPYNDYFAWRAQGIWETINIKESKGGPFRSYVFYDEQSDKTFHLNYLIHHPGNDKSIFMRQLDLIVKSFTIDHS